MEPRDFVVGDVDGDKRTDLILLVHDRILIYRQDSGEKQNRPGDTTDASPGRSNSPAEKKGKPTEPSEKK